VVTLVTFFGQFFETLGINAVLNGEYRLLRKGSNEWTSVPAIPGYSHDEPGCFDQYSCAGCGTALPGRTPRIDRIGISYMYFGTWQSKDGSSGGAFGPVPPSYTWLYQCGNGTSGTPINDVAVTQSRGF
jgi:hypothetical protein